MRPQVIDLRSDRIPALEAAAGRSAGAAAAAPHEHDRRSKQYAPPRDHSNQLRGGGVSAKRNRHAHKLRAGAPAKRTLRCRLRRLVAELEQTCNRRRESEQVTVSLTVLPPAVGYVPTPFRAGPREKTLVARLGCVGMSATSS